ncbi:MAG: ATP-binding protein [Hylemonella sp.]|nr:ATP-binding protein [Hylemonella sp.]
MGEKELKYQLCRMVLINAGTNLHVPSGRITAIDPRGGAAVLGDNGVGKTTTLRILPLFFGHLPSQIVSVGQGQEPMVRFILPTGASAIGFEYQRGSDGEEDLRLAVIRRRADDPDVPFYRLYRCGFRKELFVEDGRFLDDEETQLKASSLGIQATGKLTTAEYRSVILRTPATSKEKERLRRYSLEWSFGPKALDNLDRLVAAMVKKHINFADIVQVAVGLVQQDLGHGAERAKLAFKQGKAPIERWIRNRDAVADAFKLTPKVVELEENLRNHRVAETKFRARRADVLAVKAARISERSQVGGAIDTMTAARAAALEAQTLKRATLQQATALASTTANDAKATYDEQATLAQFFEKERAAHWELQVQDLPSLQLTRQSLSQQVEAAESEHSQVTTRYGQLKQDAITAVSARTVDLEKSKQPHRDRLTQTLEQIAAAETAAQAQASQLHQERRSELAAALEPLIEQRAAWELRKNGPAASAEATQAAEQASERLNLHIEQRGGVAVELSEASRVEGEVRRAFSEHEQAIRTAKADVEKASSAVDKACLRLNPNPGTLLAALRNHADDAWKRDLAKVIDPELLDREDLAPVVIEDAAETVYGWQLNTGVITAPDWSNDEQARQAVAAAESRHAAAEIHLQMLQNALTGKSEALKIAETEVASVRARLTVLDQQTDTLKTAVTTAKHKVETEKRDAVTKATAEWTRLRGAIDGIKAQQRNLESQLAQEQAGIKTAHGKQRSEARVVQDAAIASVDASITRLAAELEKTVKDLGAQLQEQLSQKGVNVQRLGELKSQLRTVTTDIEEREAKKPLVQRWAQWLAEVGAAGVEALRVTAVQAQDVSRLQAAKLAEFDALAGQAAREYEAALASQQKRLEDVKDELTVLEELEEEFGDYQASGSSVIDLKTSARELRGMVHGERKALTALAESIAKRSAQLRQQLTARENQVRELVETSLETVAESSDIRRAEELCACYKHIGPQVANDVNLTLKTLLTNIGAFQKSIQSFEKEVAAFNKRLQNGLSEVRRFERIKDMRLDIITNFENLGFYKKLARMDEVVRRHANEFGKDYTRELPPEETARALGEFMTVLSNDGGLEVNLSSHITLRGSVTDNGQHKEFKRASELENISSEGLTSLVLITLMTALLNTIRGAEPVHVPWVTDEVGKFDPKNFLALMLMLQENRIDVVTASPELGPAQQAMFAQRYLFEDRGRIREYRPSEAVSNVFEASQTTAKEVVS